MLLVLGVYFSRRLERYKAGNAYFIALSNHKIRAYENVSEILIQYLSEIESFFDSLNKPSDEDINGSLRKGGQVEDIVNKSNKLGKNFRERYIKDSNRLLVYSIHFSKELQTCIEEYNNKIGDLFAAYLRRNSAREFGVELEKLRSLLATILGIMDDEINRNPFE